MVFEGDPSDIRNWQRRSDTVTTSGKLSPGDPKRLAGIGIKHVINLAVDNHPEALEDEAKLLAQAGVQYTHIPVPFDAPSMDHVRAMKDAIEASPRPVHLHCIMNYRVTGFFYLLDREAGVPEKEARARMAEIWDPLASDHPSALPWKSLLTQ